KPPRDRRDCFIKVPSKGWLSSLTSSNASGWKAKPTILVRLIRLTYAPGLVFHADSPFLSRMRQRTVRARRITGKPGALPGVRGRVPRADRHGAAAHALFAEDRAAPHS